MTAPSVLPDLIPFKRCSHCKETKPRDAFAVNRRAKSGLASWCKACRAARYHADPEPRRQSARQWYAENKEYANQRAKAYRETHKEQIAANQRAYREANADQIAAFQREYRLAHREETRAYRLENADRIRQQEREYQKTHRGQIAAYRKGYRAVYFRTEHGKAIKSVNEHKRRARKAQSDGQFTRQDLEALRAGQTDKQGQVRCWWCGEPMTRWHIDHRIPLAKGGSNAASNLCLSCADCNLSKRAKLPHEWIGRLL